jgi:hypothetical protein
VATSIYIAGTEARSGKSAVAVGLLDQLSRRAGRIGVFRPIVRTAEPDELVLTMLSRLPGSLSAEQGLDVEAALDQRDGGLQLARGPGGDAPASRPQPRRGGHGPAVGGDDGEDHVEALDEPLHLRGQREAPVEDDAGQRRERRGPVREQHPQDDVLTVAGHDHDAAVEESVEDVRHRHRPDHQTHALALEPGRVAVDQSPVARLHQVPHRRGPQQRCLRECLHGDPDTRRHSGPGRLEEVSPHPVGHHPGHMGVDAPCHRDRHLRGSRDLRRVVALGGDHEEQP